MPCRGPRVVFLHPKGELSIPLGRVLFCIVLPEPLEAPGQSTRVNIMSQLTIQKSDLHVEVGDILILEQLERVKPLGNGGICLLSVLHYATYAKPGEGGWNDKEAKDEVQVENRQYHN